MIENLRQLNNFPLLSNWLRWDFIYDYFVHFKNYVVEGIRTNFFLQRKTKLQTFEFSIRSWQWTIERRTFYEWFQNAQAAHSMLEIILTTCSRYLLLNRQTEYNSSNSDPSQKLFTYTSTTVSANTHTPKLHTSSAVCVQSQCEHIANEMWCDMDKRERHQHTHTRSLHTKHSTFIMAQRGNAYIASVLQMCICALLVYDFPRVFVVHRIYPCFIVEQRA